jgi:hypothetical protein
MSTANTVLRVGELDFGSIKENLKTFLRSQSEFQDFDFNGSGMDVLLDVLAYNTHYMGFYLNVAANEAHLDTAQVRNSIISHAKKINYTPTSAQGALAKITVVATPAENENDAINILTLDKYTRLLGADIDGVNHPFVTLNSNTISKSNGSFTFANVFIKQGEVATLQYQMDSQNINRRFTIPSPTIDTSTLTVTVQESSSNTFTREYTLADDITEISANSRVFFLEENRNSLYDIVFGDDVIGSKPKVGNIVIATYLQSVGSAANNISAFTFTDQVGGEFRDNVSITSTQSSYGGTDKETAEQVRFRAPYSYSVQNRAVIDTDYETLITKDYNNVDAVSVWGGEENDPVVYGKVFISIKPKGNYFLTNLDKERIVNDLIKSRSVMTVIPEIVDPNFVFLNFRVKVNYNPKLTSLGANEIAEFVRNAIIDYKERELDRFSSVFRKSKLQSYIEDAEKSITGSDLQVYIQKREEISPNEIRNYEYVFDVGLNKGDFIDKLYSTPQITVKDIENNDRQVFIEEVPNSFTGIDNIIIQRAGRNYIEPPLITISGDGTGATARAVIVNGKVDRINIINRGVNYTRATVSITGGGGREAFAIAQLQARNGQLRTFYFKSNGEKVIVNSNAGAINYETGLITLTSLNTSEVLANDFYAENILTINVPPARENLYPLRNRILTIDENDATAIQIEMIAED